jgi:hypothetical protein
LEYSEPYISINNEHFPEDAGSYEIYDGNQQAMKPKWFKIKIGISDQQSKKVTV